MWNRTYQKVQNQSFSVVFSCLNHTFTSPLNSCQLTPAWHTQRQSLYSSEEFLLCAASKTLLHLPDFAPAYFTTLDSKPGKMLDKEQIGLKKELWEEGN